MVGVVFFFFQAEDGIRDIGVTGVQTCALPIYDIPARLCSAIQVIYIDTHAKFITLDGETDEFEITSEVLQGDTLALP